MNSLIFVVDCVCVTIYPINYTRRKGWYTIIVRIKNGNPVNCKKKKKHNVFYLCSIIVFVGVLTST